MNISIVVHKSTYIILSMPLIYRYHCIQTYSRRKTKESLEENY